MNYASIGSVIGHVSSIEIEYNSGWSILTFSLFFKEITHGFDDQGRQFDLDGNLVDWWDPETNKHFLEKAQCIIDQYGNYTDLKANLSVRIQKFNAFFYSYVESYYL